MAIDPEKLLSRAFSAIEHAYDERDTILYALGVGVGGDPLDPGQLRFVYEKNLQAIPSMIQVLGYPGFWAKEADTGIDWRRLVHVGQRFILHRPLRPTGLISSTNRVSALYDRGADKGAILVQRRDIIELATGEALATVEQTNLLRGDGGFGGTPMPPQRQEPMPSRTADIVCDLPTPAQLALIYRLCGDRNPLHADPEVARAAGFERPIMHGMGTLGVACYALLSSALACEAEMLREVEARFTAPFFPGETLRTEIWREEDGAVLRFRASSLQRTVLVLDQGRATIREDRTPWTSD